MTSKTEDDLEIGRQPQKWLLVVIKNYPTQSPHLSKMTPLNLLTSQNDPPQSHAPKMTPLNLLTS